MKKRIPKKVRDLERKIKHSKSFIGHYVDLPKNILVDKNKSYALDSFYGQITHFRWLSIPSRNGANISPILYLLNQCREKYEGNSI